MPEPGPPAGAAVYQLRVVLRWVSPLIWRRLLVPTDTSLEADWKQADPSWAPSLVAQAFPVPLKAALAQGGALDRGPQAPPRHIERTFGPDLGLGL